MLCARCSFLARYVQVFKYLRLNSRMNLLWRTVDIAVWDLAAFFTIFLMVFCGYAIMGFLLFGPQVGGSCGYVAAARSGGLLPRSLSVAV